jgi:2-C-methyl-D-erythritol 4-phosphate cytidylyltransferase
MAHHYAIVPAAGSGARFGAGTPKQYLPLLGRPLIWYSLAVLCRTPGIARVWVVLAPDDVHWARPEWCDLWRALGPKLEVLVCGGATRAASVANALAVAATAVAPDDWVLVHDAARPCLAPALLDRLLAELADDAVGGLLAVPLADTVKRADTGRRVVETPPRDGLWLAQTPQMFRYGMLRAALAVHDAVTDEAGAIEAAGFRPRLVPGETSNLKVTYPADLGLAEWILRSRAAL